MKKINNQSNDSKSLKNQQADYETYKYKFNIIQIIEYRTHIFTISLLTTSVLVFFFTERIC